MVCAERRLATACSRLALVSRKIVLPSKLEEQSGWRGLPDKVKGIAGSDQRYKCSLWLCKAKYAA
jgi:hypothetical protein